LLFLSRLGGNTMTRTVELALGFGAAALLLAACAGGPEPQSAAEPSAAQRAAPTPEASINAMMVALVDHAAHVMWDAEDEKLAPKTDRDWMELEHHAIQLVSAGAVVKLGGTGPADPGWASLPPWQTYAQQMTDAAQAGLKAARAKDQAALVAANGRLVESCEACHKEFKPALPTEGISHPH
jgi:cytochrome c556